MPQGLTLKHFDNAIAALREDTRDQISSLGSRMNKRFDSLEARTDVIEDDLNKVKHAVLDYIGTDRALHNLVRELREQGLKLQDSKIFG